LLVIKERSRILNPPDDNHDKKWWQTLSDREIDVIDEDTRYEDIEEETDDYSSFSDKFSHGKTVYSEGMIYRDPVVIARRKYLKEFVVLP